MGYVPLLDKRSRSIRAAPWPTLSALHYSVTTRFNIRVRPFELALSRERRHACMRSFWSCFSIWQVYGIQHHVTTGIDPGVTLIALSAGRKPQNTVHNLSSNAVPPRWSLIIGPQRMCKGIPPCGAADKVGGEGGEQHLRLVNERHC